MQSIPRDNRERKIIFIRNSSYAEKVRIDAAAITLRGERRAGTRIEFAQGADEFRARRDDIGQAVVNLEGVEKVCLEVGAALRAALSLSGESPWNPGRL